MQLYFNDKTPFYAVKKWYELDDKIFTEKTENFKNEILLLKPR